MKSLYLLYVTFFCFTPYCTSINVKRKYRNVQLEMEKPHSIANIYEPSLRINGGYPIEQAYIVKFMAFVLTYNKTTQRTCQCGGSLITTKHVLTAAHCVREREVLQVVLGARKVSDIGQEGLVVGAAATAFHVLYDIGIIKLERDIQNIMGRYSISTVRLESASAFNTNYDGAYAFTCGWGLIHDTPWPVRTDILHYVLVKIISNQECLRLDPHKSIHAGHICTSGENVAGTCKGDSGGPLIYNGIQIGITSRGVTNACEAGKPSVYVRVAAHRNWIDTLVRIL